MQYNNGTQVNGSSSQSTQAQKSSSSSSSSGVSSSDVVGTWVCHSATVNGQTILASQVGVNATITFNSNGTCTMLLNGEQDSASWSISGGKLVVDGMPVELSNGQLLTNISGGTLVFVRQ